jgi:hypothetical protein
MNYLVDALVQASTIFVISTLGTLIGFPLVKLGHGWGKILGSHEFKSPEVLFVGVLASAFFTGILFEFVTPLVNMLLHSVVEWIPTVISVSILALYGWFCVSCEWRPKLKIVGFPVLIILGNIAYLYFAGYFSNYFH